MSDDLEEEFEGAAQRMPEFQPTNAPAKNILVIDDKMDIGWSMLETDLAEHIDVRFDITHTVDSAISMMTLGGIPDVIMLDAFRLNLHDHYFGYDNACALIKWLKENHPEKPLPDIIFSSGELDMSESSADRLYRTHQVVAGVTDKGEFTLIKWDLGERDPKSLSYHRTGTAIRQVLNTRMGLDIPLTDEGFKQKFFSKLKKSGEITFEMLVDMVDKGEMTPVEALQKVKPRISQKVEHWHMESKRPPVNSRDIKEIFACMEATGNWAAGPAAFSFEEAQGFIDKGERPVLICQTLTPEAYPYLEQIAGIVILSPELCGHAAIELGAWGISSLIGAGFKNEGFLASVKTGAPIAFDTFSKELYQARLDEDEVYNKSTNSPFYNSLEAYYISTWERLYREANNIKGFRQVYTIDSMKQVEDINFRTYGTGLVRSESLVKENALALAAFKDIVLRADSEQSLENFRGHVQATIAKMLKTLDGRTYGDEGHSSSLRYRLLDMPPSEIFNANERQQIKKLYGDENIRGAQMGLALPSLYEAQLKSVFAALKAAKESNIQTKIKYPDASGMSLMSENIEILVPTVKTAAELEQIKIMTATIAAEYGLTEKDYDFGAMIENTDACNDIEEIAKLCDFISFGTNDLTESVLGVKRDDMEGRMKTAQQLRQPKEPYQMLYPQVLQQMHEAITRARNANPDVKVGVCGSGSADVKSFVALHNLNVDSVSMQPSDDNFTILPLLAAFEMVERHEKRQQTLEISPLVNNIP